MQAGRRLGPPPSLDETRAHARAQLDRLPDPLRRPDPATSYRVQIAGRLVALADQVDRRLGLREAAS
jgi:nicotinate phosphoribosyltransferase